MADNGKNDQTDELAPDEGPSWAPIWATILRDEESDLPCPPVEEPPLRLVLLTQLNLNDQIRLEIALHDALPRVRPLGRLARWLYVRWPRLITQGRVLTEAYDAFINKRYEVIARKLEIALDEVKDVFEEIKKLKGSVKARSLLPW